MYAVTSIPLVSRTRATLRSAEFGFLGVVVYTRVQTPRRCGLPFSAGVLFFATLSCRPLRTSCWIVGTTSPLVRSVVGGGTGWCRVSDSSGSSDPRGRACRGLDRRSRDLLVGRGQYLALMAQANPLAIWPASVGS